MTTPVCRLCLNWKRKTAVTGVCWLRAASYPSVAAQTTPEASCESWTAKTVKADEVAR
jgi:hypothetical protein